MIDVEIYTDGACKYNPGPGGYCGIAICKGVEQIVSGYEPETTNNRMELTAVIKSLQILKKQCNVTITTDSKYVCDSINKGWMQNWKNNNWKKGSSEIPNVDLWMILDDLLQIHCVTFKWIKGHNGHEYNERCDKIAVSEIEKHIQEINEIKKKQINSVDSYIYADYASSGPVDDLVAQTIIDAMKNYSANPSSAHKLGRENRRVLEDTREKISNLLKCEPSEIIFTSGGTESNNLGIIGLALGNIDKGKHIICSNAEHSSVYKTCKYLEKIGFDISFIDPDDTGMISCEILKSYIREDTILACIMHVNNEFGTINPINEIAELCHEKDILLFSDGVAAYPHLHVDFESYKVDGYSISGHKFGTPPGVGLLFIKNSCKFTPCEFGGNQENGKRPGTENLPYILGLLKTIEIKEKKLIDYSNVLENTKQLISLLEKIDQSVLNGSFTNRIAGNVNFSFAGIKSDALLLKLNEKGICISSKSSCETNEGNNRVIESIQKDKNYSDGTIRISFYNELNLEQILMIGQTISSCVEELRKIHN